MNNPATEEDEERAWLALINHSWAKDWSDPREDVYTLEDGKPSHEIRLKSGEERRGVD
jgi:hypothetical protein